MTPDEARAYLSSLSFHRNRAGDVAFMHPDFAVKLASAIQYAKTHGLPDAGLLSGYREASDHPSSYDEKGWSSHEYGIAADVSGIGPAGSSTSALWRQIATKFGLYSPYDPNGGEWNHWQLNPKPLEQDSALLNSLVAAKRTGDPTKMWAAFTPSTGVTSPVTNAVGAGPIAQGPDNRQIFFDAFVKAGMTPQQALGALWSMGGESHPNIDTSATNPNDPGGALGALQWTQERKFGLQQFAASVGKPVTDPNTQAQYAVAELTGTGPAAKFALVQPGVWNAITQVKTPEEASRVWTTMMERPANAAARAEERIKNGAAVGSIDANGHFVPGTAAAAKPGAALPTGGAAAGAAPPVAQPPSDLAQIGSALGSALSGLVGGNSGLTGSPGTMLDSSMDQPAIRTPALNADFTGPGPSPVPAGLAAGAGSTPLGTQLGALGAVAPDPMLENPQVAPSITAGAPSMTSLLGGVGGAQVGNIYDPRRPQESAARPRLFEARVMAGSVSSALAGMVTATGGATETANNSGQKATSGSGPKVGGSAPRGPQTPQTPARAQTRPPVQASPGVRRPPPPQTNQPKKFSAANPPMGTPMPGPPHPGVAPPYPDGRSPHPTLSPTGVPILPPPPNIMGQGMAPLGPRVPLTFTPGMTGLLGR